MDLNASGGMARWNSRRGDPPISASARRTYSPILRQATLPDTITVPWWDGRTLRYQYD